MNVKKRNTILVLHGPNMNLLGRRTILKNKNITLDKLNRHIKKTIKDYSFQIKIVQTNEEGRAVTLLQRNRNLVVGIIIFPGPWQHSGYVLKDTLELLKIPFITISQGEKVKQLVGKLNVSNDDLYTSVEIAIKEFDLIK